MGNRLLDLTRVLETGEAMVVVVEKMEDQYKVKLRNGSDLALDVVEKGLAEWHECSVVFQLLHL